MLGYEAERLAGPVDGQQRAVPRHLAVQRDVSTAVPLLRDGAFTNSGV